MKSKNNKSGKLEKIITDKEIIEKLNREYDLIREFHEGLAAVRKRSEVSNVFPDWGFINTDGELVIPMRYNKVSDFKNGISIVILETMFIDMTSKELTINNKGDTLHIFNGKKLFLPFEFLEKYNGELYKVASNGKWGLIDKNGKVILPTLYDSISDPENGISLLKNGNDLFDDIVSGCISDKGVVLIPPVYDRIDILDDKFAIVGKRNKFSTNYIDYAVLLPF